MNRFGYTYEGERTSSATKQKRALIEAGVAEGDIFTDRGSSRDERDWLMQEDPETLREGDVVTVACEAYIGAPGRDRRRVLRVLADKGVSVQVLDREPVLYDTAEKIDEFLAEALRVSRSDNGKVAVANITDRKGRPPVALRLDDMTEAQKAEILRMWHDHRFKWREVADKLADFTEAAGMPRPTLNQTNLTDRFGNRFKR